MPIYEYRCGNCGQTFDVLAKFSDPDPTICEQCGAEGQLEKVLHPAAVHYKGSGFYATDYASKRSGGDGAGSASASDSGGGSGAESGGSADSGSGSDSGSSSGDSGSSSGGSGSDSGSGGSSSPPPGTSSTSTD